MGQNPLKQRARKKLERINRLLKKYGDRYGFDWLLIAAQAYQESQLNQRRVSRAGAVGIMQVLPKTAASRHVDIRNIRNVENNIHAGVKYMDYLRRTYFSGPEFTPIERLHFSHAAYNAGPRNVKRMRRLAKRMGLKPNVWFGNVERAALRIVGRETVRYVANIRKYYIAYKLADEKLKKRVAAKKKVRSKLGVK